MFTFTLIYVQTASNTTRSPLLTIVLVPLVHISHLMLLVPVSTVGQTYVSLLVLLDSFTMHFLFPLQVRLPASELLELPMLAVAFLEEAFLGFLWLETFRG